MNIRSEVRDNPLMRRERRAVIRVINRSKRHTSRNKIRMIVKSITERGWVSKETQEAL